ncbi:MAG: nucleotide-binding protein [Rhizobiaceae bacterium]|nr:nucleotide-binding protein [Rhizobiaceae bacterium]
MPDETLEPERGAVFRLQHRAERGSALIQAPELSQGQVRMWTASVRGPLREIFGHDSPVFAHWPAASGPLPTGDARALLSSRLSRLESLVAGLQQQAQPTQAQRVFIGHGRSPVWRELKDFLQDRLNLRWEEFNRESVAGIATTDRLVQMLDNACFAFLIMTAEDEHTDQTLHARENVIHEVGLFQGKLGLRKAIILLEDGCSTFSNIHGLTYIGFPRNRIASCFEEIRRVLERERIEA